MAWAFGLLWGVGSTSTFLPGKLEDPRYLIIKMHLGVDDVNPRCMKIILFALLSFGITNAFSQSVNFSKLTSLLDDDVNTQYWYFAKAGFSLVSAKDVGSETLYDFSKNISSSGAEGIYFGTTLKKKDGTRHATLHYMTLSMNYMLSIIKQMPPDMIQKAYRKEGLNDLYSYETDDYYLDFNVTAEPGQYSGLLLVNKHNK